MPGRTERISNRVNSIRNVPNFFVLNTKSISNREKTPFFESAFLVSFLPKAIGVRSWTGFVSAQRERYATTPPPIAFAAAARTEVIGAKHPQVPAKVAGGLGYVRCQGLSYMTNLFASAIMKTQND